jgi:hypothetical protein
MFGRLCNGAIQKGLKMGTGLQTNCMAGLQQVDAFLSFTARQNTTAC